MRAIQNEYLWRQNVFGQLIRSHDNMHLLAPASANGQTSIYFSNFISMICPGHAAVPES